MYNVIITGITGKSGQSLLQRLMKEATQLNDYKFILLCRKSGAYSKNTAGYRLVEKALKHKDLNVDVVEADLENKEDIAKAFDERIDMLLHAAGIKLSLNIVSVALKKGVDNFILVHTTGIYSKYKEAGEEYRQIETKIDRLICDYRRKGRNVALTILRPTMIYGDLNDKNISVFIKMVDKFRVFPTVNGARYDLQPVWSKNLGEAYYDVMKHWDITRNKEYILSGEAPVQLREIFEIIGKQLGVKNVFISCPYPIAYFGACVIYMLSLKKVDYREKVQRLVEPRAYPHDDATKDFGYNPVSFDVGVKDEIEMYISSKR